MIAIQRFTLRMALATLVIGSLAGCYVLGYEVGYYEALRERYFQPAVVVKSSE